jgi:Na+/H+-translocating membrane pyrophosphatase
LNHRSNSSDILAHVTSLPTNPFPFLSRQVGDVAGMGADLFESFVGSIIAAAALANGDPTLTMLPFWVAGAGIFASVAGYFAVGTKDGASQHQLLFALHKGTIVSGILVLAFVAIIISQSFSDGSAIVFGTDVDGMPIPVTDTEKLGWKIFSCVIIGLFAGILIGQATEYFTSYSYWPTRSITEAGVT